MKTEKEKKRRYGLIYILLICLVLAIVIFYLRSTSAQYITEGTGKGTAEVALWSVAFKGSEDLSFDKTIATKFTPSSNSNVVSGKIAPSSTATGTGTIRLTGTETAVKFSVEVDETEIATTYPGLDFTVTGVTASNAGGAITLTNSSGVYTSGAVALPSGAAFTNSDDITLTITVKWKNDSDDGVVDTDIGENETEIEIPIKVTVEQYQS